MPKRSVRELQGQLRGKRVFVRVDFNVPMEKGQITDDRRIRAALPTIDFLAKQGARVILATHLGRPSGPTPELRLDPIAERLSQLIGKPVTKFDDSIGQAVEEGIAKLKDGDVSLLENVRFYPEEETNEEAFSQKLSELADIYVNDAFGTAHRAHASTEGIAHFLPSYAGFLMDKELEVLERILHHPKRPFVAIIGGAKVSSKIGVLKHLLPRVDTLIIGGGMAYTFLKVEGYEVGKSLVDAQGVDDAELLIAQAEAKHIPLLLPKDVVVASELKEGVPSQVVPVDKIPSDKMGVDAGPITIAMIRDVVKKAQTVLWNGPVGVFEIPDFAKGTNEVAKILAESKAITVVGGGDSAAAIERTGFASKMTHISTGGGATLEYLEGKELPGVAILPEAKIPAIERFS